MHQNRVLLPARHVHHDEVHYAHIKGHRDSPERCYRLQPIAKRVALRAAHNKPSAEHIGPSAEHLLERRARPQVLGVLRHVRETGALLVELGLQNIDVSAATFDRN